MPVLDGVTQQESSFYSLIIYLSCDWVSGFITQHDFLFCTNNARDKAQTQTAANR
ncbi:hypothetical protein GCM10007105_24470 [Shewanella chilikensis]|nr:hypothetical protein GCM10007105_24470 [Shewanella chilikensis]